jgi:DNA-binding transcriptional LysR family regulator
MGKSKRSEPRREVCVRNRRGVCLVWFVPSCSPPYRRNTARSENVRLGCRRAGFKPRIVKEADGAASALAFVAAGFGVAVVSEPLQKIPAKDVVFRNLTPEDRAWVPVGAAWKPEAISAPVVSKFVDVLAQACARGNGGSRPSLQSF